jgi:hypothetical protein
MKLRASLFILASLVAQVGCRSSQDDSKLNWGHLNYNALTPSAPQFLINQKPGEPYRVCLPQYMKNDLPGVEAEIGAAINVWAQALGRNIDVQITTEELPRASTGEDSDSLREKYYEICGEEFDVVLGYVGLGSQTVGETGVSWMVNGRGEVMSFKRHLFLRDFTLTPASRSNDRSWQSLASRTGTTTDAQTLVTQMTTNPKIEVEVGGKALALPVLTHEFGHVWGLCDQYEGPSNCDPNHSSDHKALDAIMAASSNVAKLYLTEDDLIGIRELAKREGYNQHWPDTTDIINAKSKVALPDVRYFSLRSANFDGSKYTLDFGVVTGKAMGQIDIQYRTSEQGEFRSTGSIIPLDGPVEYPQYSYQLRTSQKGLQFRLVMSPGDSQEEAAKAPLYSEVR